MDRCYFDHNATTPVSSEALAALVPCLVEAFGNASSIHHYGQAAKQKLEAARRQVASAIRARPEEIVFTSGGTESDNLAIHGARGHVITTAIEHPAVLNTCAHLAQNSVEVTYLRPDSSGLIDPGDLRRALRPSTTLISVIHANNELGTIQPLGEICRIGREAGVPVHSDGVQALGKIPIDVTSLGVDLCSLSGHKVYAPKGVGALYVRQGVPLSPLLYGGHHERDRRPGTENVPGAVAFGCAVEWAAAHLDAESARLAALRDRIQRRLLEQLPDVAVNGASAPRTPNTTNICFEGIEGEALLIALDLAGFAVSSGAACSSGAVEPSHVLLAIGLTPDRARSSLRFSLGRSNAVEQVDALVDAVCESVARLRRLSPTYTAHA